MLRLGAGNEIRTRYLHLGKVALCQMSYARRIWHRTKQNCSFVWKGEMYSSGAVFSFSRKRSGKSAFRRGGALPNELCPHTSKQSVSHRRDNYFTTIREFVNSKHCFIAVQHSGLRLTAHVPPPVGVGSTTGLSAAGGSLSWVPSPLTRAA